MLDPLRFSDPIVKVYEECVDELLVMLARHFNTKGTGNTSSFEYEVEMLSKMGAIRRDTAAIIARHVAKNEPMIELAIEQAMLDALENVEPELKNAAVNGMLHDAPMELNDFVRDRLTAYAAQAREPLNLVNTVMLEGTMDAYRKGVYAATDIVRQMEAAQTVLNVETGKVSTGVSTLQKAVKTGVTRMHREGITGFVDRGGHKWSSEAYVRMDIKTTVSNIANRAVMERNAQYGNDLIWVRTNATARPGCYPWQGKVISMDNRARDVVDGSGKTVHAYAVSETTYGQPDGIFGINCHHGPMNVFVPGLSYVRMAGTEPPRAENDAQYELTQEQRRLERAVRYAKRELAMLKSAGADEETVAAASRKVKLKQTAVRAFVRDNPGLVRDYSREAIYQP